MDVSRTQRQGADSRVPVTVVTGYLGSRKTTLINRILADQHGRRIAVIVNESGEFSVDGQLILRDEQEDLVEFDNGCLCCTVRGDLIETLAKLQSRAEHDDEAGSFVLREDRPIDIDRFTLWPTPLLLERGEDIYRTEGIFHALGFRERVVFQSVRMLTAMKPERARKPDEARRTEYVLIGRNLDRDEFAQRLASCAVSATSGQPVRPAGLVLVQEDEQVTIRRVYGRS